MEKLRKLKEKEERIKQQITMFTKSITEQRSKLLALEEVRWELQDKLHKLQREIILQFKGLSKDEVLAIRSGLSVEEIKKGRALLAKEKDEQKE